MVYKELIPQSVVLQYYYGIDLLVQSQGGKLRQICVPKAWQERVRRAVDDYRKMQELIEEVSELEWKRLKERKR